VALKPINLRPTDGATVTIMKIAAGITVGKLGKTGSMRLIEKIATVCQNNHIGSRDLRVSILWELTLAAKSPLTPRRRAFSKRPIKRLFDNKLPPAHFDALAARGTFPPARF